MQRTKLQRQGLVALYAVAIVGGALVLYLFAPGQYVFYPRCALNALTGLQCPGCGGLRATHQLLHGHWAAAWSLNPLIFLVLPVLGVLVAVHSFKLLTGRSLPHPFAHPIFLWVIAVGCLLFAVLRNVPLLFSSPALG